MVRAVITEAIAKAGPGSVIQQFIGREPVWKYILRTNMPRSSVWGTEVENLIFTAAQILQMDIYTYTFGQGTSPDQDKLSWVCQCYLLCVVSVSVLPVVVVSVSVLPVDKTSRAVLNALEFGQ
ncbi:hypothetical protein ACOMHN_048223 [Nucella lapillus]